MFGQIHGGCAQGIGQALLEENVYDRETGQLITGSFMDYAMPRATTFPDLLQRSSTIACRPRPIRWAPRVSANRARSGSTPTVMNAIMDALWPLGVRNIQMPATPLRVWRAIQGTEGLTRAAMKQRIFGWISILIGVVLALATVEVAAIAWLYLEDGHYTPAAELFERTQNTYVRDATKGTACRYVDTLYPHPYVGFVHHANPPCGQPWVNNVGLYGPDFPVIKNPDYYTVILTGGSVASQLGQNQKAPAPRYLEEELNKQYVSPTGKPWLVLNGADGAWKEPQPFILFSLYASSVDAVVSLGGYNEYYFFWPQVSERLERPLSNFIEVNPFVADENFGDAAIGWVMGRLAGTLALNPVLGHSHAAYMIIRGIEQVAKGQDVFKSTKKTTLKSIFNMPVESAQGPRGGVQYPARPLPEVPARDGGGRPRQWRQVGLLPPAGAGLRQGR